ncbi:hypothetical protein BKA70DRAFT_274833 [Coprinopsis sp. MPI-PUGE-AT-0042]|nr:hypothetical protein BKA70DRAFT_274833 [Coprinopsis sp. MPI-PUGE-AT-0042]
MVGRALLAVLRPLQAETVCQGEVIIDDLLSHIKVKSAGREHVRQQGKHNESCSYRHHHGSITPQAAHCIMLVTLAHKSFSTGTYVRQGHTPSVWALRGASTILGAVSSGAEGVGCTSRNEPEGVLFILKIISYSRRL